ncbi:MAG: ribosomal L7Ae/L30e/S12e/Gadd45 family protein [archaeon]
MAISIYDIVEKAAKTGKIDKGINEVTKAVERGVAKLAVVASDVDPKELVRHISIICKEKGIKFVEVDSKQKLGIAAGIGVPTTAVAIIEVGDAKLDTIK